MDKSTNKICPPTLWAQTRDRVLLTFLVQDTKDADVKFESKKIIFSGKGGIANQCYHAELELVKEIDPEQSKWDKTSRLVTAVAIKKDNGPFWPRLLETKAKQHWLKVDFDKMKDSDESSDDEAGGAMPMGQPDLAQMMAQMGRGTGTTNFDDLENDEDDPTDSDDEPIPGLETAEPAADATAPPAEEAVAQA